MSSLPHQRPRASSADRAFVTRWGGGFLLLVGALLMVLGSCGSNDGPPEPSAAVAGTIDAPSAGSESAGPVASSADGSDTPAPDTSSAEPAGPVSGTSGSSSAPVSTSPAKASGSRTRTSKTTKDATTGPSTTRSSIVVPSFDPPAVKGPVLPASPPVSITIPAISVNAPTMPLGLLADGTIEVPPLEETNEAGWYTGSPAPGVQGPSVILGHVDSAKSGPSVFYSLGTLKPGDEVSVTRKDNTVAVFKIDGVREYGKNDFPTEVVYGNLDHAGLRLITCGGTFDPKVGHYESNIVAFASLVSSHPA